MKRLSRCAASAVLIPFALAGCDSAPAPDKDAAAQAPAAAPARAAPPAAEQAARPVSAPAGTPLVLAAGGLELPGAKGGAALPFGAPAATALAFVGKALGGGATERGRNEECGGGALDYATWKGRITLLFEDGRFAGWDDKGALKTASGIGLGSRRSELRALPGLKVETSTLGVEFRAGALGGILSSPGPDAKVTAFWAGITCVFR